jgi:hypothetical protein
MMTGRAGRSCNRTTAKRLAQCGVNFVWPQHPNSVFLALRCHA